MKITIHDKPKYRSVFHHSGSLTHYVNGEFHGSTKAPPERNKAGVYVVRLHNGEYRIHDTSKIIREQMLRDGFKDIQFVSSNNIDKGAWQEGQRVSGSIGQIYLNFEDGVYTLFRARVDFALGGGLVLKKVGERKSIHKKFKETELVAVVSGKHFVTKEPLISFIPLIGTVTFEEAFEVVQDEAFLEPHQRSQKDLAIDIIKVG